MTSLNPIALAQALIRCPSVTPVDAGVLAVLEEALTPLGFACHRLRFEEEGTAAVENLYARLGTGAPHFCFAGHTDVVPVGDAAAWNHDPFAATIEDGMLYGRGAEDMKGAIAAFTAAVSRFVAERGAGFTGSISFLITGDEEGPAINGTRKMLHWLKKHGHVPDVCLVGEPTNPDFLGQMAKIGRRGSMNTTLTVTGRQGHVAYPHLADNPVTRLVRILARLKEKPLDAGSEFFPPSNLEITSADVGNPAVNVIPAQATARFNIRFNDRQDSGALARWIAQICREEAPECHALDIRVTGEAFLTPPGRLSALLVDAVREITGHIPELSTTGGTSDARFIKDLCPVIEFGTTGKTTHMVNECVAVDDLRTLERIYRQLLEAFFQ